MNFRKIIQKEIPEQSREFKDFIKDPLLCDLLSLRGITTPEEAKDFLECKKQPLSKLDVFCDGKKAVKRILEAVKNNEKILVWGDFDADGVTSSALMHKTLKALNANFEIFIPDREEHGHGINLKAALQLVAKHRIKVIITVDCGISNANEINVLNKLGVDIIITDHHKLDGQTPDAYAVLNPQAPYSLREDLKLDEIKKLSMLSGVGVAYKLALALLGNNNKSLEEQLLILACIGTISDVVPLLGENRTIVANGLDLINQKKHKGVKMLFENNGRENITSTDIAFILTPRINAVGRLSTPQLAFDFLVEENESSLNFILEKLDNFNKIRQSLCENIFLEARDMVLAGKNFKNKSAIILFKEDWHIGIIGIVASKLVEEFLKPVFMVTSDGKNGGRCSIRSIEGYNVYEILKKNEDLFEGYGGHSLAGGFSFDMNAHPFDEVKTAILQTIEESDIKEAGGNCLYVDKILEVQDLNIDFINSLAVLEPCGQDNAAPLFALKNTIFKGSKTIGKNANHLKFFCTKDGETLECVKWNEGALNLPENTLIDIAFSPSINRFNGQETIQLEIADIFSEKYSPKNSGTKLKIYDHRKKTGILSQIADYLKRDDIDVAVWAKSIKTLEAIKNFPQISNKAILEKKKHDGIMFFDYPASYEELKSILCEINPRKIHIMNDNYNENIENSIKILSGMLKYSNNHKSGEIDIEKMAQMTGTSEAFVQLALEIFESCTMIDILDVDKIRYIKPVSIEKISSHSLWEILTEEFNKITEFKKHLAEDDLDKMYELISSCLE